MSPASYLTAPPRVATTRIASVSVPWWTWIALGFFVVVVLAGSVITFIGLGRMRSLQAAGVEVALVLDDLTRKTEGLEARLAHANENAELVERRMAHLQESLERLSVLSWALGDVTKAVSQLRSAVMPRK
jgi:hypothetical protein